MLAKLKDDFINHPHFSSRSTVLTFQMMPFPEKLQSQTTQILPPNSGQQINILSKVCACAEMTFFGQLTDFIFVIFIYLYTVSCKTGNIIKQFLERRRSVSPSLPKSPLLTFVIIWPILLGISRHSLMPSKI